MGGPRVVTAKSGLAGAIPCQPGLLPDITPDAIERLLSVAPGADEATDYVTECGAAWHRTPGAVVWLTKVAVASQQKCRTRLIHFQAAVLRWPATEARFRHNRPATDLPHRPALCQFHLGRPQQPDDLLRRATLPRNSCRLPRRPTFSSQVDPGQGGMSGEGRFCARDCRCEPAPTTRDLRPHKRVCLHTDHSDYYIINFRVYD